MNNNQNWQVNTDPFNFQSQTIIPRLAIETLSFPAVGLLAYIITRPTTWNGCEVSIARETRQHLTKVSIALNELKAKGWLVYE